MGLVYVAGRTNDIERVRDVQSLFRYHGHQITYDWTGPEGAIRHDWRHEPELAAEISALEVEACKECDLLVLMPSKPGEQTGLGCFVEFGVAIGAVAEVWVVDPTRESVFFYHSGVIKVRGRYLPEMIAQWGK